MDICGLIKIDLVFKRISWSCCFKLVQGPLGLFAKTRMALQSSFLGESGAWYANRSGLLNPYEIAFQRRPVRGSRYIST